MTGKRKSVESGKKLKIAMIGQKYCPSRCGGVEVVVTELSVRLVQLGHEVTCINRKQKKGTDETTGFNYGIKSFMGIKLKQAPTINIRGFAAVSSSISAAFMAAFGKYDVVHFHAEGPAFMCFLPKLFGKRVVVTVHGLDHMRSKWGSLASTYIKWGEKNAVRFADEIIVLSRNEQNYFASAYGRKTVFIPNGTAKPAAGPPDAPADEFLPEKDSYFLFVGRLVPEKGLKYLIEAFKGLDTDKKLLIAGESSDTDKFVRELKKMSEGDERIVFTGFVRGQTLEKLYSNAFAYVLPSDVEGMPLSLLEAMSCGCCCIVSSIEEMREVVEDHALVFEKGNAASLKNEMNRLLKDVSLQQKYKKEASEFICARYSWDDTAARTARIYAGERASDA